jgi:hypothetical protein
MKDAATEAINAAADQSWWAWARSLSKIIGSAFTEDSLDKMETITEKGLRQIQEEMLPEVTESAAVVAAAAGDHFEQIATRIGEQAAEYADSALENVSCVAAATGDHLEQVGKQVADYTGETFQKNLNGSATHATKELKTAALRPSFVAGICLIACYFSAKTLYDGLKEFFKTDTRKNKVKPAIKMGIAGTCFAAATYTAYKQFE